MDDLSFAIESVLDLIQDLDSKIVFLLNKVNLALLKATICTGELMNFEIFKVIDIGQFVE